jgi:hypothetical protein
MDDNACPHRAKVVQDYLEWVSIEHIDWPARSPDLNPIDLMWNELQVSISARRMQPGTIQKLGAILVHEWAVIPVRTIRNLIGSMGMRCQAVIDSHRSHTRYKV